MASKIYDDIMSEAKFVHKTLGRNVKAYRQLRGYSQEELSKRAQLNRPRISAIEGGEDRFVNVFTVIKLAKALSLLPYELIIPIKYTEMIANKEYIIKINDDYDSLFKKKFKSLMYLMPEHFKDQKGVFPRWGKVHKVPRNNVHKLQEGDLVILHHHAINFKISEETDLYHLTPDRLWAYIRKDKITMLNHKVMVDVSVEKPKAGSFISPYQKKVNDTLCTVRATYENSPFKVGQKIGVFTDEIIDFKFGDDTFNIVFGLEAIPFVFDENMDVHPVNGWVMIEPLDENELYEVNSAGIMTKDAKDTSSFGKVVKLPKGHKGTSEVGDTVFYEKRNHVKYSLDGKDYYFANTTLYESILLVIKNK